jgi:hypothetical protein
MSFTLTEKALIALATMLVTFHAGKASSPVHRQVCSIQSPSTTMVNPGSL